MGNDSEFEEGRILGHAQEQRRLEMYFHDRLAPELMALAYSIESALSWKLTAIRRSRN